MYLLTCNTCGENAFADCVCSLPEGAHDSKCPMFDLGRNVVCDCCPQDHSHDQAANETGNPCRPITITAIGAPVGRVD